METYIYYYKSDSKREPIGRVKATSLHEAREFIMKIKQLSEELVTELFEIKRC
jgi:hypothetical protein